MAKCPECGAEIDYLKAFCYEQNRYYVNMEGNVLDYSHSEAVESSCTRTDFECPECDATLFKVDNGESQPKEVIDFLKADLHV